MLHYRPITRKDGFMQLTGRPQEVTNTACCPTTNEIISIEKKRLSTDYADMQYFFL